MDAGDRRDVEMFEICKALFRAKFSGKNFQQTVERNSQYIIISPDFTIAIQPKAGNIAAGHAYFPYRTTGTHFTSITLDPVRARRVQICKRNSWYTHSKRH